MLKQHVALDELHQQQTALVEKKVDEEQKLARSKAGLADRLAALAREHEQAVARAEEAACQEVQEAEAAIKVAVSQIVECSRQLGEFCGSPPH